MFLPTFGNHHQAVCEAGVAMELTIGAHFGAFHEMLGVRMIGRCSRRGEGEGDG